MEGQLRRCTSPDGYALSYRTWTPAGPPRASVVWLTGIMSNSRWLSPVARGLRDAGLHLVGADRRGAGPNRRARGDAPNAAAVIDDALAIIDAEVPAARRLIVVGWCWGSVLGLNVAARLGSRLAGLSLVAPGLYPSQAIKDAAHTHEAAADGAPEHEAVIASPIDDTMFTEGPALEAFIRRDPERLLHFSPRYRAIMGKLALGATLGLRKLQCPLQLLLADDDRATDNDAARAAVARLPRERVQIAQTRSGHGLQFDAPEWLTTQLVDFAQHCAHAPSPTG